MKIQGKITRIFKVETIVSKEGKEWKKQTFVIDTAAEYNNVIAFEVFGEEKCDRLLSHNKVGDEVTVEFDIKCNEWKNKYYTSLQSWKVEKVKEEQVDVVENEPIGDNSLPF